MGLSNVENILEQALAGEPITIKPESRVEALLIALIETGGGGGGGGGTTNYNALTNLPRIEGITLKSNKTASELGLQKTLTFDSNSTEGSNNPVKSGGVFSDLAALRANLNSQIELKVDKITGKGLSTEDFTSAEKTKLSGIENGAEKNIIASIEVNGTPLIPVNKAVAITILTKSVDDLVNYYKKTETYTKTEVDTLINSISSLTLDIVEQLPTSDISTTTIYLVPVTGSTNVYMQYAYINGEWAQLGTTQVDLTNYYTKAQIDALLGSKQDTLSFDSVPTANSENPVTSGGVKTALDAKQNTLELDLAPTENSAKFVNSGAIFTALLAKLQEAKAYTDAQIADFGGFQIYNSIADITDPNIKTIYLIKDYSVTGADKYREYIYRIVEGEGVFDMIGDTSFSINIASTAIAGIVKVDGTTVTIDSDGTIHAAAGVDFDEADFVKDNNFVSLVSSQRIFTGTQAQWEALSTAVKKTYGQVNITDDESGTPEYYSTEEVKTNKVWIDGKPIYRKVFTGLSFGTVTGTWTNTGAVMLDGDILVNAVVMRAYDNSIHGEIAIALKESGQLQHYSYDGMAASGVWRFDTLIVEYTKAN